MDYDVLVVGSGIGGMESALKLAEMGRKVLLVEKEASIGGRMILLSKVFPTLDCASCISGPKMSSTINHPNITTKTYAEIDQITRNPDGLFTAKVRNKARYVDLATCTACSDCETACTVAVPDQFNAHLAARRAAYIPFPQAVPKKSVIERAGTSPCIGDCPAGIKAHGYVSLVRAGKYEEAFQLVLEATPLVGTLGRACYAPCEAGCTRGALEGPLPIRLIKRFAADKHYESGAPLGVSKGEATGKKVAIVGSGPAGLTAAWQLGKIGHDVVIYEASPEPGGYLRYAIPSYRLPKEVVRDDIANLAAVGVDIRCNTRIEDVAALKAEGYDAVIVAVGTPKSVPLGIPGEDAEGVMSALEFLRDPEAGSTGDIAGKRVVVVGGGNVAMDALRVALRQGASDVVCAYRRTRTDMPCHHVEADDAETEGARFEFLVAPVGVETSGGRVTGLRCQRMQLGEPDASGRRRPEPIAGSEFVMACDVVVTAIGLDHDTTCYDEAAGSERGKIKADSHSLQTSQPWLFAAGDVASGATDITHAIGAGRRAAHMVDRWLNDQPFDGFHALDDRLESITKEEVLARQQGFTLRPAVKGNVSLITKPDSYVEIESPLTEEEATRAATSCLDCGVCSECQECIHACPAFCIDLNAKESSEEISIGSVIVATGHKLFAADLKPEYGYGQFPNVITGMQMDRLLAPTRPFNTVLRPSDGKVPDRIAYVSCTGSRDKTTGNPLCSKFCCMYSIKQNQLIMGALPLADVTMHYMDMRASGKRYDEFYQQAQDMGAQYIKGRVAGISEQPNGDLVLRYEDIDSGGIVEAEYDLVVLAVGIQPNREVEHLFSGVDLGTDEFHYVAEPDAELEPGQTTIPGVFVAGTAAGAKDIVDSIMHAGAAVAQAAAHLETCPTAVTMPVCQEVQR